MRYGGETPFPVGFQLQTLPSVTDVEGAGIFIETGAGAGGSVSVDEMVADKVSFWFSPGIGSMANVTGGVRAGDKLRIHNSDYIAVQTYHRHNVPGPEFLG